MMARAPMICTGVLLAKSGVFLLSCEVIGTSEAARAWIDPEMVICSLRFGGARFVIREAAAILSDRSGLISIGILVW